MPHETTLVATIAVGLAVAFLFGFAAARIGLPPLVGYLVAGVVVGPFTPGYVADSRLAGQLAEIGVILLMFGVGLHFSFRDLAAVRRIAVPGAAVQIAVVAAIGAGVARLWGWETGAALVFGLALSVGSTVVLLRALEQRGSLDSVNGRIAVGWLIAQDIAMVLALVLLPALAGSSDATPTTAGPGGAQSIVGPVALTLGKVAAFIALMLFVGARAIPWMLGHVARLGSRELFTLSVLAVALGIAFASAMLFGVSFAVGAFFAGVVVNGSDLSHAAAAEALPLQDAFAVLFFVSVGMLVDPAVFVRQPLHLLGVVALVMLVTPIVAFTVVTMFRYPVATALTVAAGLAQIGEFSFILAGLGISLGVLPEEARSLILAGAVLTITLNSLAFRAAASIEGWLRQRPHVLARLERPGGVPVTIEQNATLTDHAIVVGYGRVGRTIGTALARHGLPFVVVEQHRETAEDLRRDGVPTVYGDAARAGILQHAHPERARLLVVTAPDPFHARQIIDLARRINPGIPAVVRTHSEAEQAYLEARGEAFVVMGERELALGMARYALRSLGVESEEAEASVQAMRPTTPATDALAIVLESGGAVRTAAGGRARFGEGS